MGRARGVEDGAGRRFQVNVVARSVFGERTVTGEGRVNIVLGVCGHFGHGSWRKLRVQLDAGLAVLELNQGFDFILNQLGKKKKRTGIKKKKKKILSHSFVLASHGNG